MGWWGWGDDIAPGGASVHGEVPGLVSPQPGQVRAHDRVDLVLPPVEIPGLRPGQHGAHVRPPRVGSQAQLGDRLQVVGQGPEGLGPGGRGALLVGQAVGQGEQPDECGVRVHLDAHARPVADRCGGVGRPSVPSGQPHGAGLGAAERGPAGRVRGGGIPAVGAGELAFAVACPALIRYHQRGVHGHHHRVAGQTAEPTVDLLVASHTGRRQHPPSRIDHGQPRHPR